MATLLVMRHAKSSWVDGVEDHARPLNARGRAAAEEMGRLLRARDLWPDLALVSDALRTRETWAGLERGGGGPMSAQVVPSLYLPTLSAMVRAVQSAPPVERLLVLSHNPGCEVFTGWLTGVSVVFRTATIAELRLDGPFSEDALPRAELVSVWEPAHPEA
jgi:phosphohistidine phosphatase